MVKVGLIKRMFFRTIVLKQTPNGTFVATDITNFPDEGSIVKADTAVLNVRPDRIFPVTGLKNIERICIQEPKSIDLMDISQGYANASEGMPETVLQDMLDNAYNAGRLEAEGTGGAEEKWKKQIPLIMILGVLNLFAIIGAIYMMMKK